MVGGGGRAGGGGVIDMGNVLLKSLIVNAIWHDRSMIGLYCLAS